MSGIPGWSLSGQMETSQEKYMQLIKCQNMTYLVNTFILKTR